MELDWSVMLTRAAKYIGLILVVLLTLQYIPSSQLNFRDSCMLAAAVAFYFVVVDVLVPSIHISIGEQS
jgi:hypothetical protein